MTYEEVVMRRLVLTAFLLAVLVLPLTAEVSWTLEEDGQTVTVTWVYEDPDAQEVYIAGTFNSWDPQATLMTKEEGGRWTYTRQFSINDTVQYKFVVDGNWVTDETAPDFKDDGFGGKNSYLNLMLLISQEAQTEEGGAAPKVKLPTMSPVTFGTWTILRSDTGFLTRDLATGEKSGFDLDYSLLYASSYWKLQGDILPGWNIYAELQVAEASKYLYKASTVKGEEPEVPFKEGLEDVLESAFHPADAWLNDTSPVLGHFKVRITNPYVNLYTGYKWSKGTEHVFLFNTSNADDNDANAGFTELSLGEKLSSIGDRVSLDVVVAPNKRLGTDGVYSWFTTTYDDAYTLDLAFNSVTDEESLFNYSRNHRGMFSMGIGAEPLDGLSLKAAYLLSYQVLDKEFQDLTDDSMAWGVEGSYQRDTFGVSLTTKLAGPQATTIYGDDDTVKPGNLFIEFAPWVRVYPMKFSLTTNATFTNELDKIGEEDKYVYYKPQVDVDLSQWVGMSLTTSLYTRMQTDFIGKESDLGFKLMDVGSKTSFKNLAEFLPGLDVYYALAVEYGTYDVVEKAYPAEVLYNALLFDASLPQQVGLTTGLIVRTNLKEEDDPTLVPFGMSMGAHWTVPSASLKNPVLFANIEYNFHPYGKDGKDEEFNLDEYRPSNLATQGTARFVCGLRWDF